MRWCKARGRSNKWSHAETLAAYIADLGVSRKWEGVWSEIASVGKWFELERVVFPGKDPLVKKALVGLKKMQKSRVNKKSPVKIAHLRAWAARTKKLKFPKRRVQSMVLFLLGFFAGLRVAELVKLRWKNVSCKNKVVILRVRRVKGAQAKERWPILPGKDRLVDVARWLGRWWREGNHKKREFLFPGRKGHLSPNQVRILVKELVQESGDNVMKFSSHSLHRRGAQF